MTKPPPDPDAALRDAILTGNIVFVAGTGVSVSATCDPATKSPHPQASWTGLLTHGLQTAERMGQLPKQKADLYLNLLSVDPTTQNLISAATTVTNALGGAKSSIFKEWLEQTIGQIRPLSRDIIDALHALREADNLLATTNYDDVLLDHPNALQPVTWMDGDEIIGADRNRELDKVIYLPGYLRSLLPAPAQTPPPPGPTRSPNRPASLRFPSPPLSTPSPTTSAATPSLGAPPSSRCSRIGPSSPAIIRAHPRHPRFKIPAARPLFIPPLPQGTPPPLS